MGTEQRQLQVEDLVYELLIELGELYLDLGRYSDAIEKFKLLLDLGETDAKLYQNISKAYLLNKQFDQDAREVFEKTLEIEPTNVPIIKVLTELYLKQEIVDETSMNVFWLALESDPEKQDQLSRRIISVASKRGEFQWIGKFIKKLDSDPQTYKRLVAMFLTAAWERHGFEQVAQFLEIVDREQISDWYDRYYLLNLLMKANYLPDQIDASAQDWEIYNHFIETTDFFHSLNQLELFLATNRLFENLPVNVEQPSQAVKIEEYELFLSSESFSTIWEAGLNKRDLHGSLAGLNNKKIWQKLQPISLSGGDSTAPDVQQLSESDVQEIFQRSNCLLTVRTHKTAQSELEKVLLEIVKLKFAPGKNFIRGFSFEDGIVFFWENIEQLVLLAHELNNRSSGPIGENRGKLKPMEIVIHNIGPARGKEYKYLYDDLQLALRALISFQKDLISEPPQIEENQIVVSEPAKNLIKDNGDSALVPAEIKLKHPVSGEDVHFYRLCWQDALTKVKKGEITTISKFRINKELHPNQIFSSYKAIDSMLERLVVLKILKPGFKVDNSLRSTQEIFITEARKLGKLVHPQIAMIYEVNEDHGLNFIAREFVEGDLCAAPKRKNNKIDWQQAVNWCARIADVLAVAHENNIIHGRLKPENIIIVDKDELKLTDFHIPGFCVPVKQMENIAPRTLTYLAPELIESNEPTRQTDMFALGVLLYELVTDINPFIDDDRERIFENLRTKTPAPVHQLNKQLPDALSEIIFKAIEKAPVQRYQRMDQIYKNLSALVKE
ncbi:MAG TPA: hypothetical protein ENN22_06255 [bacterium]|nr:hypothetical protein [bacterium]